MINPEIERRLDQMAAVAEAAVAMFGILMIVSTVSVGAKASALREYD